MSDIKFDATSATSFVVKSDTLIFVMVENPGHFDDSAPITITNISGTSTPFAFSVTSTGSCAPTVTSFAPAAGPDGACWVTINGTNLAGAELLNGDVLFNGTTAFPDVNVVSQTKIEAMVPAGATDGPIRVTTYVGSGDSSSNFDVDPVGCDPSIVSFSPGSGPVGTAVTLTGANFLGATAVDFNGTAAGFVVLDASHISAFVPAGATTGPIHVVTLVDTATSVTDFVVGSGPPPPPVPTCTSRSPASGPVGTSVTILGTGLDNAQVTFNGTSSTETFNNSTEVHATVPASATDGPIQVTTPGGSCSPGSFDVTTGTPPSITSISPTSGPVGTLVTITGTNLTGTTLVTFNGVSASFTNVNATTVTATVPATATTGEVELTTPFGTDSTGPTFTVVAAPNATGMSPTSGPVGTSVTITGTNLSGATVRFNGVVASCSSNTATQIVCTVPATATTGPVTVQTAGGTDGVGTFTVTVAAPNVTSFSPTSGLVGAVVTLQGTNLASATFVRFNGVAAGINSNTATQIVATVPAGASGGDLTVTTAGGTDTAGTFVVKHARTVTLHFSKAKGNVTVVDGFAACAASTTVKLQHKEGGKWKTVATGTTNSTGGYNLGNVTDPGKYRVIAKKSTLPDDICKKDVSPTVTL